VKVARGGNDDLHSRSCGGLAQGLRAADHVSEMRPVPPDDVSAMRRMDVSQLRRIDVSQLRRDRGAGMQPRTRARPGHPSVPITSLSSSVAVYDDDRLAPGQSRVIALETSSLNAVMPRPSPGQHLLSCVVLSALLANGHGWQNDGIRCRDGEYGKCLVLPSTPKR
jgi:hypothetical protein